tara:strand:- start:2242 stop:2775 length:534 start_codon:yes stop_codon:yes gene_type:complete
MATRKVRIEGIGEWARVFSQNREMTGYKPTPQAVGAYEECNGACKIDVIMNDENYKKLKASKSMKTGTDDALDRGKKVTFVRKFETGRDWDSGEPIVLKEDNTRWDYEVDGPIGNGSIVEVTLAVYDIKKYGNTGTRLERVKVLEHNKYDPNENDEFATPAPNKEQASETVEEEIPF